MKKSIITAIALSVILPSFGLQAQEIKDQLSGHFSPYGFFRSYAIFDSRDSQAGSEDLFYYLPLDKDLNRQGKDIYANPSFKMYAITTRLGLNMSGYQSGSMKASGKIEADFYLMNGSSASLRLRQAYVNLRWDDLGYVQNSVSLTVGQAWHPMSEGQPYCVNVESGSPFNPFSRSPQLMFNAYFFNGWTLTAGILYPMQYLPTGPNGASEDYMKYSMVPEVYAGVSFKKKHFQALAGVDFLSLKPRWRTTTTDDSTYDKGTSVRDRISMLSPMLYCQYEKGVFKFNAKSVLASGGDHLRLMGGYAVYDQSDIYNYKYTPLRSTVSYISFSVGSKWQFMCMAGYMKALGTEKSLSVNPFGYSSASSIYYFSNGFKNINQMIRATPTLAFNAGHLTLALEYDNTCVQYGDIGKLDAHGLCPSDLHWIINHRVLGVFKFNF